VIVSVSLEAERELIDGALFYTEQASTELGLVFIAEFERALEILREHSSGVTSQRYVNRSILSDMKVATGKVVGGKVVLEGVSLEEGTSVTVLAKDDDGSLELTPEQEAELLLSIAEADRGETVSAEEVLAKLVHRRG